MIYIYNDSVLGQILSTGYVYVLVDEIPLDFSDVVFREVEYHWAMESVAKCV